MSKIFLVHRWICYIHYVIYNDSKIIIGLEFVLGYEMVIDITIYIQIIFVRKLGIKQIVPL